MTAKSEMKTRVRLPVETIHGTFLAHYSDEGLARLDFPEKSTAHLTAGPKDAAHFREASHWHKLTVHFLKQILANKPGGDLPPLDLSAGTDFQRRVWLALRKIKPGQTATYAELAARVGQPKAARAVGGACGANPIPVLIPCHRVLAANGKIGGFSGGLKWKETLLAVEGLVWRK